MSRTPHLLQRIHQGLSTVELVWASHPRWPLPPSPSLHRPLDISVLDSSFNPPTTAHLAIANSPFQKYLKEQSKEYDAKLLLLSVRNADKTLKPGDATFMQRVDMMTLIAQDTNTSNIAVAIINEPTFIGKSRVLREFIHEQLTTYTPETTTTLPYPRLTFLIGFDTLTRLIAPRYYQPPTTDAVLASLRTFFSPTGDGSRIVCARRSLGELQQGEVGLASEFIEDGNIILIDIGEEEQTFSSSELREKHRKGDEGWKRLCTDPVAGYITEHGLYEQKNVL